MDLAHQRCLYAEFVDGSSHAHVEHTDGDQSIDRPADSAIEVLSVGSLLRLYLNNLSFDVRDHKLTERALQLLACGGSGFPFLRRISLSWMNGLVSPLQPLHQALFAQLSFPRLHQMRLIGMSEDWYIALMSAVADSAPQLINMTHYRVDRTIGLQCPPLSPACQQRVDLAHQRLRVLDQRYSDAHPFPSTLPQLLALRLEGYQDTFTAACPALLIFQRDDDAEELNSVRVLPFISSCAPTLGFLALNISFCNFPALSACLAQLMQLRALSLAVDKTGVVGAPAGRAFCFFDLLSAATMPLLELLGVQSERSKAWDKKAFMRDAKRFIAETQRFPCLHAVMPTRDLSSVWPLVEEAALGDNAATEMLARTLSYCRAHINERCLLRPTVDDGDD